MQWIILIKGLKLNVEKHAVIKNVSECRVSGMWRSTPWSIGGIQQSIDIRRSMVRQRAWLSCNDLCCDKLPWREKPGPGDNTLSALLFLTTYQEEYCVRYKWRVLDHLKITSEKNWIILKSGGPFLSKKTIGVTKTQ